MKLGFRGQGPGWRGHFDFGFGIFTLQIEECSPGEIDAKIISLGKIAACPACPGVICRVPLMLLIFRDRRLKLIPIQFGLGQGCDLFEKL